MDKDDKKLTEIRKLLEEAEKNVAAVKRIIFEHVYQEQAENLETINNGKSTIVEGVFDGENMIDKFGKKYPVPANYCSKSKLVAGDNLKLTIYSPAFSILTKFTYQSFSINWTNLFE